MKRQPTAGEIAEHMELSDRQVRHLLVNGRQPLRLEEALGEDNSAEFGDLIEDTDTPLPAEVLGQQMLREDLEDALNLLPLREKQILRLRYGLDNGEFRTLKEVGKVLGLTRERIRQLEQSAINQLRAPGFAGHLRQYLE